MLFAWKYSSSIRFVFHWNFSQLKKALWFLMQVMVFLEFLESIFILPLPQSQITFQHETPCRSIDMTSYRGVGSNQNMGGQIVNRLTIAWFSVPWVIHQKLGGQMPIQITQLLRPCHSYYHLSAINLEVAHCMVRNLDVPTRLLGLPSSFK